MWALCTARSSANCTCLQTRPRSRTCSTARAASCPRRTEDKNKLYTLYAPEVECISKGKARTPYEFGVKVNIATTSKEGLVVAIADIKMDGRLGRNPLKGALGDALHAVRCGFGHNLFLFWPHSSLYAPDSACRYRRSSRHCWSPPVTVDLFRAENVIIQDGLLRDTT